MKMTNSYVKQLEEQVAALEEQLFAANIEFNSVSKQKEEYHVRLDNMIRNIVLRACLIKEYMTNKHSWQVCEVLHLREQASRQLAFLNEHHGNITTAAHAWKTISSFLDEYIGEHWSEYDQTRYTAHKSLIKDIHHGVKIEEQK